MDVNSLRQELGGSSLRGRLLHRLSDRKTEAQGGQEFTQGNTAGFKPRSESGGSWMPISSCSSLLVRWRRAKTDCLAALEEFTRLVMATEPG